MKKFHLSPEALRDMDEIYSRIGEDSISNADRVIQKLDQQFDRIGFMPGIGHIRSELDDDTLRVISEHGYLIIYDPTSRPIEILRLIHGAMDLRQEFRREL